MHRHQIWKADPEVSASKWTIGSGSASNWKFYLPKCSITLFVQWSRTLHDSSHISAAIFWTPCWETPNTVSSRARKLPYVSLKQNKNVFLLY